MHGNRQAQNNAQQWGPWNDGQYEQDGSYYPDQHGWQGEDGYDTYTPQAGVEDLTSRFGGLSTGSAGYGHSQGAAHMGQGSQPMGSASSYAPTTESQYNHDATQIQGGGPGGQQGDGGGTGSGGSFPSVLNNQVAHHLGAAPGTENNLETGNKGKGIQGNGLYDDTPSAGGSYSGFGAAPDAVPYSMRNNLTPGYAAGSGPFPSNDAGAEQGVYDMQQAIVLSRAQQFDTMRVGEASNASISYGHGLGGPYGSSHRQMQLPGHAGPYGGLDATPRTTASQLMPIGEGVVVQTNDSELQNYQIAGSSMMGRAQLSYVPGGDLYHYQLHHSSFFKLGHVFKTFWSEPLGQGPPRGRVRTDGRTEAPTGRQIVNFPEGRFYVGYRRFLIVKTDESNHSTCVPILTYENRACCKPGVHPSKHGIIYAEGNRPMPKPREPQLGFQPVPLQMTVDGETLADESRVNYSKLVTIEHNTLVYFIGKVPVDDFPIVADAVDKCWNSANRHRRRRN